MVTGTILLDHPFERHLVFQQVNRPMTLVSYSLVLLEGSSTSRKSKERPLSCNRRNTSLWREGWRDQGCRDLFFFVDISDGDMEANDGKLCCK